jgi:polyisoprenyl-phosphate glycosyltransferase
MKTNLEANFISIVLIAPNSTTVLLEKLESIQSVMDEKFINYEVIVVDNNLLPNVEVELKKHKKKVVLVQLAMKHDRQSALAAGIDIAIGDYIFEIEDATVKFDYHKMLEMYDVSQTGYDFVFCAPKKTRMASKIFYNILNRYYHSMITFDISSSIVTLSSRRGQNKTAETGQRVVNHNVSYALTGLKSTSLNVPIVYSNRRGFGENIGLVLDTFIYYTDLVTRTASVVAVLCFLCALGTAAYSIFARFFSTPVSGWSSIILLGSLACAAIFLLLAIVCKYLKHILSATTQSKNYIYKNIIK